MTRQLTQILFAIALCLLVAACSGSSDSTGESTLKDTAFGDIAPDLVFDTDSQDVEPADTPIDLQPEDIGDSSPVEDTIVPEDKQQPDQTPVEDTTVPGCPQKSWPQEVFSFKLPGQVTTTPAITSDGNVVFATSDGTVFALDCHGKKVWDWKFPCTDECPDQFKGSVVVASNGTIIVSDNESAPNFIFGLTSGGQEAWKLVTNGTNGRISTSPVLTDNDTIVVGTHGALQPAPLAGEIWALGLGDGKMIQNFPLTSEPAILSSPATLRNIVFFAGTGQENNAPVNTLYALNLNGERLWTVTLDAENIRSRLSGIAIDHEGFLVVAQSIGLSDNGLILPNSYLYRYSPFTGSRFFRSQISVEAAVVGSPLVRKTTTGSEVIVAFENGKIAAYDLQKQGNPKLYETSVGQFISSTPILGDDGMLYVATLTDLLKVDQTGTPTTDGTHKPIGRITTHLSMDNRGVIYFGTINNRLVAVATGAKGPANSPWPSHRRTPDNQANWTETFTQCAPKIALDPFTVTLQSPVDSFSGAATVTTVAAETGCTRISFNTSSGAISFCYRFTGGKQVTLAPNDSVNLQVNRRTVDGLEQHQIVVWRSSQLAFFYFSGTPDFPANGNCNSIEPCPVVKWGSGTCSLKSSTCGRLVHPSVRLELQKKDTKCVEKFTVARGDEAPVKNTAGCNIFDAVISVADSVKYLEKSCVNEPSGRFTITYLPQ